MEQTQSPEAARKVRATPSAPETDSPTNDGAAAETFRLPRGSIPVSVVWTTNPIVAAGTYAPQLAVGETISLHKTTGVVEAMFAIEGDLRTRIVIGGRVVALLCPDGAMQAIARDSADWVQYERENGKRRR